MVMVVVVVVDGGCGWWWWWYMYAGGEGYLPKGVEVPFGFLGCVCGAGQ